MTRQHRTAACLISENEASGSWSNGWLQSVWLKESFSMSWSTDTEFNGSWTAESTLSYSWYMIPFVFGFEFSACRGYDSHDDPSPMAFF